jgi:hypothetical protein
VADHVGCPRVADGSKSHDTSHDLMSCQPLETNLFNPVFYNKENNHPTQTKVKFDEFTQLYHLFLERGEDDYFKQTIEDMMKCTKDTIAEKNLCKIVKY